MTVTRLPLETGPDTPLAGSVAPTHAPLSEDERAARRRWTIAIGLSVAINLVLIVAIIFTLPPVPIAVPEPIPVHIVPPTAIPKPKPHPPAPKPRPKPQNPAQQRKQTPKPPPGRLASEDLGDPNAPENAKQPSQAKAAGPATPQEGSEQPTTKGDAAAIDAAKPTPASILGTARPKPVKQPKPAPKLGGSHVQALLEPPHNGRHHAKYPGPDATKDAYFAYLQEITAACMTPELIAEEESVGRPPLLAVTVRRNGVILWVNILKSSGSPTFDLHFKALFDCVGQFPPLPNYLQGTSVQLLFGDLDKAP